MRRSSKILIFVLIGLFSSSFLFAQHPRHKTNYEKIFSLKEIERRAQKKYILQKDRPTKHVEDDLHIGKKDTLKYNLFVKNGDLFIKGTVLGDVVVLFGDVHIDSSGVVDGSVTAINGRIYQEVQSVVSGNQIETNIKNLFPAREFGDDYDEDLLNAYLSKYTRAYGRDYSTFKLREEEKFLFRFNRVQGVFLGISFPKFWRRPLLHLTLHGYVGYGLSDKRTRYRVSLDHWLFNPTKYRFEVGASLFDEVKSKDRWIIGPLENTLAALFFHDDYLDYYRTKGYEYHVSQNLTPFLKATVMYRSVKFYSLQTTTNAGIFTKGKAFRDNPAIDEGLLRGLLTTFTLDTRDNVDLPRSGWFAQFSVENALRKWKGDFSFRQYIFEVRRYQRLGPWERLDLRFKIATAEGVLPVQRRFHLGGLSTLRAFTNRSLKADGLGGDRMLLFNAEYVIHPRIFDQLLLFDDEIRYILFFDMGDTWLRASSRPDRWDKGFEHLKINSLKSDLGIAISSPSGRFRVNFAKRLDTSKKAWRVSFRISKPF